MLKPKDRLAECIQKQDTYISAIYKKANSDLKTYIQTESKRTEKYMPCKWKSKESWSSNPHIRQNRP